MTLDEILRNMFGQILKKWNENRMEEILKLAKHLRFKGDIKPDKEHSGVTYDYSDVERGDMEEKRIPQAKKRTNIKRK